MAVQEFKFLAELLSSFGGDRLVYATEKKKMIAESQRETCVPL